ncbi:MAG: AMP-binding protein [Chitinophagaceae bacterium]|nr:AMP-binding protein [Chitinophagaceae bacterium]
MPYPYQITSLEQYHRDYQQSVEEPEAFWSGVAEHFYWRKKWDRVLDWNFTEPRVEWFGGGKLNITENCIDRHLKTMADKPAIIWEPNNPEERTRVVTYARLHKRVCQFAQVLINNGVKKGDRVCIYMGMVPELAYAVLGCARIGAIHSVIFGGFSAQSIADRLDDAGAEYIVTCDGAYRGGKDIPLKSVIDDALIGNKTIKRVIVYTRTRTPVSMLKGRDVWWEDEMEHAESQIEKEGVVNFPAEEMDAEDPLFILYTSGSTGKPKGVVHTTAGYMVWTNYTFVNVFQYKPGDIHFCTADIGWITGHSYILYGPLSAGATSLMFEGIPTWPDAGRFWDIVDKHKVNILYTAPTAIRSLMGHGLEPLQGKDLSSLKILGTVGEPINEEAWHWYDEHVGKTKCPVVDTWWQTETGGCLISNLAGVTPSKPSWATLPMPGVQPVLVDEQGLEIEAPSQPSPVGKEEAAPSQPSPKGKELDSTKLRESARRSSYPLLKELSKEHKKNPTEEENILWQRLRDNQTGHHIRRQHIIDEYIVDFICIKKMLNIEVDGGYHLTDEQKIYDEARTQFLIEQGFVELRFTNDEVRNNIDSIVERIKQKLNSLPDAGQVSPFGGDLEGATEGAIIKGNLCLKAPWPGILRTTWGDHERCRTNYFATYPGLYFTGDGALKDAEGNYRITGRVDDVLNVSGHRIGTAEVENAINMHAGVVESAVVGYPHDIKGQGIYAFVIYSHLNSDSELTRQDILQTVSRVIGAIAKPDKIQFVSGLPKTRSGKIMRRILRKIAEGETENLGDTTTLLDPGVVEEIKEGKV